MTIISAPKILYLTMWTNATTTVISREQRLKKEQDKFH